MKKAYAEIFNLNCLKAARRERGILMQYFPQRFVLSSVLSYTVVGTVVCTVVCTQYTVVCTVVCTARSAPYLISFWRHPRLCLYTVVLFVCTVLSTTKNGGPPTRDAEIDMLSRTQYRDETVQTKRQYSTEVITSVIYRVRRSYAECLDWVI